jgi:hypothetical protein
MVSGMLTHSEQVAARVPPRLKIIALLHDAIEDGHVDWSDAAYSLMNDDADALYLLTRRDTETYDEYIDAIIFAINNPHTHVVGVMAGRVKLADLEVNIARSNEQWASLLPRYHKAHNRISEAMDKEKKYPDA